LEDPLGESSVGTPRGDRAWVYGEVMRVGGRCGQEGSVGGWGVDGEWAPHY
jgi:hypothetical protein